MQTIATKQQWIRLVSSVILLLEHNNTLKLKEVRFFVYKKIEEVLLVF